MSNIDLNRKLATVPDEDFIGRTRELEKLFNHGKGLTRSKGLILLSTPSVGASELLRQTFDHFFFNKTGKIPFYFSVDTNDKTTRETAFRFLKTFLQQVVAFTRRDANILDSSSDIDELAQLSLPADGFWVDRLIASCRSENVLNDDKLFIRNCLSAPSYAAGHGVESFVLVDNLHHAEYLVGQTDLIEELKEVFTRSEVQFVLSGRRRLLLEAIQKGKTELYETEILQLEPLEFADAGKLAENLSEKYNLKINDQTRDLISRKFLGHPLFIKFLFQAAKEKGCSLDNFHSVERIYTREIFEGKIGGYFDEIFAELTPEKEVQKRITALLYDVLSGERRRSPIDSWQKNLDQSDFEFNRIMRRLYDFEIVRMSSNFVEVMDENIALTDYITKRYSLEIEVKPHALVVIEALRKFLKRAPETMAKFYRLNSAIDLRALLGIFNCQSVPLDLFNYEGFKLRHKGIENVQVLENLDKSVDKMVLPQIVHTAPTIEFYPPLSQFIDANRSVVALGYETANYTDENEVIWLAAEIESKLEVSKELAEFWCDRLEMVALVSDFDKFRIWLISPEGFSREALEVLTERNAVGTSRKQIELLKRYLKAEDAIDEKRNPNEYEMVVPMGEDTELIAAHTVEEIARRHDFEQRAINQIKTALVEACINAAEHGMSPDQKIYQKFLVEDDRIVITISNRGVRMSDKKVMDIGPTDKRRGWGLKLLRTLMDEVKFEQINDGTRISMTKYLRISDPEKSDAVGA